MSRVFNGLPCLVLLLLPATAAAQAPQAAEPPQADAALTAAVKALVSTVSALSQEIRRQRDDIDKLNREVASLKKDQREATPKSAPNAQPAPAATKTLEEQLEQLRDSRLRAIEATAQAELELIDELAASRANPDEKDPAQALKIESLNRELARRRAGLKTDTEKIELLQRYIAARNEIDRANFSQSAPAESTPDTTPELENPSTSNP